MKRACRKARFFRCGRRIPGLLDTLSFKKSIEKNVNLETEATAIPAFLPGNDITFLIEE